jgi:hypothetical protein
MGSQFQILSVTVFCKCLSNIGHSEPVITSRTKNGNTAYFVYRFRKQPSISIA